MEWMHPERLLWILMLVPFVAALILLEKRRNQRLSRFASHPALRRLAPLFNPERRRLFHGLWLGSFVLLIVTLGQPQWGTKWDEVRRRGLDIMVVLDTSKSMLAEDLKPNRLKRAAWGIRDLLQELRGDRVGLIAYAGTSFVQCPLTIDYPAFLMTLDDVYAGIIPQGGTATAHALRMAMKSFEKEPNSDRVLILISDGGDHDGDPLELVPFLKKDNIRVFSIGVGSLEGELIPIQDRNGQQQFLKDREGNIVKTSLQEDVLQQLALQTGGAYVRAVPGDFGVERLVQEGLADLKRSEHESKLVRSSVDRYPWFVGMALLLLLVESLLPERVRKPVEASS